MGSKDEKERILQKRMDVVREVEDKSKNRAKA